MHHIVKFFVFVLLNACLPTFAQTATSHQNSPLASSVVLEVDKKQLIDKLIVTMSLDQNSKQLANNMFDEFSKSFSGDVGKASERWHWTPAQAKAAQAGYDAVRPSEMADFNRMFQNFDIAPPVKAASYEFFGKHFTTAELKQMNSLFEEPVFQKFYLACNDIQSRHENPDENALLKYLTPKELAIAQHKMQTPLGKKMASLRGEMESAMSKHIDAALLPQIDAIIEKYKPLIREKTLEAYQANEQRN